MRRALEEVAADDGQAEEPNERVSWTSKATWKERLEVNQRYSNLRIFCNAQTLLEGVVDAPEVPFCHFRSLHSSISCVFYL